MQTHDIGKKLFMTTNKMRRYLDKAHQRHGLSWGQARLLIYIDTHPNVYQKDLEQAFSLRGASVTQSLEMLVKIRYLTRLEDELDKRKKQLVLTELGALKAKDAMQSIATFEKNVRTLFSEEDMHLFHKVLDTLYQWMEEQERIEDEKTI